jgi:putative transposase
MWNLPPPPEFQGLHPDKPVTMYVRHLPHWRQEGATYFVTFRQRDSLPEAKLDELEQVRREWEQQHSAPSTVGRIFNPSSPQGWFAKPSYGKEQLEELSREIMRRVEQWLDQGMGSCRLKDRSAAKRVVDAMHHFDSQRYELGCYVVMPNHVHAIVRPEARCNPSEASERIENPSYELERVLQSWKRHTARAINRQFGLTGQLWQEESFDRIIRDEEHLWRALQYIGTNASKADLTRDQCPTWVRPEWVKHGWKFE